MRPGNLSKFIINSLHDTGHQAGPVAERIYSSVDNNKLKGENE